MIGADRDPSATLIPPSATRICWVWFKGLSSAPIYTQAAALDRLAAELGSPERLPNVRRESPKLSFTRFKSRLANGEWHGDLLYDRIRFADQRGRQVHAEALRRLHIEGHQALEPT